MTAERQSNCQRPVCRVSQTLMSTVLATEARICQRDTLVA
jgi:hypothetical protein